MDCPKQPKIPIYLFVGGLIGLVKLLQAIYEQSVKRRKEKFDQGDLIDVDGYDGPGDDSGADISDFNNGSQFIDIIISLFLLIWFAMGNYWVLIYTKLFLLCFMLSRLRKIRL
jgi:hypothetical protein